MFHLDAVLREKPTISWASESRAGSRKAWTEALFLQHDPYDEKSQTLQLCSVVFPGKSCFVLWPLPFSFLPRETDDMYEWLVFTEAYVTLWRKGKAEPSAKTTHHLPFFSLVATEPVQGKHHASRCGNHMREKAAAPQLWKPAGHVPLSKGTRNVLARTQRWRKNELSWTRANCSGFTTAPRLDSKCTSKGLYSKDTVSMEEWAGNSFCFCSDLITWSLLYWQSQL